MRKSLYKLGVVVSLVILATGCAGISTKTFKKFKVSEGTSISIDATQRVVLVKDQKGTRMVCAEPSPDAIVAASANAALAANVANYGGGELSGGFGQVALSIGIRTSTIQLLRDGYFRACEASMNGMLDQDGYKRILMGIDNVMVGLVAIDGLTQMKPAPTVSVAPSGSAETGSNGTEAKNEGEIPGSGDIVAGSMEAGMKGTKAESKVETNVEPTNEVPPSAVVAIAENVVAMVLSI